MGRVATYASDYLETGAIRCHWTMVSQRTIGRNITTNTMVLSDTIVL
jgi:hypothetical protein